MINYKKLNEHRRIAQIPNHILRVDNPTEYMKRMETIRLFREQDKKEGLDEYRKSMNKQYMNRLRQEAVCNLDHVCSISGSDQRSEKSSKSSSVKKVAKSRLTKTKEKLAKTKEKLAKMTKRLTKMTKRFREMKAKFRKSKKRVRKLRGRSSSSSKSSSKTKSDSYTASSDSNS
jgi:hypothetical protein